MAAGILSSHPAATTVVARDSRLTEVGCRLIDIAGALVLLVVLSPLLLLIVAAIRLDSPGGAMFRQRRVGRHRRLFVVNKFRSMYDGAGAECHRAYVLELIAGGIEPERHAPHGLYKLTADQRVTRVGGVLRRSSADELPQLWNVLRGQMSLVGPRPSIPYELERYPEHWSPRFDVKPGLTGLWQVSGRSRLTWTEMIELDLEYVERRSVRLNLSILLRTIPAVLRGDGAA